MSWLSSHAVEGNADPSTFGWGGNEDPTQVSSRLKPFSYKGVSYGLMHESVHHLFFNLLQDLEPHIRGGIRKGEEGCYVDRQIRGGVGRSYHSYGIAIDTNWNENPMYEKPKSKHGIGVLPPITHRIAHYYGCQWGGDWTDPEDNMHIEVHVPPHIARKARRHKVPVLRFRVVHWWRKLAHPRTYKWAEHWVRHPYVHKAKKR